MKRILAMLLFICCLLSACGHQPSAPQELTASLEDGAAVIRWQQSDEAESYRLYRRGPEDTDFKFIFDSDGDEVTYTDRYVKSGGTYLYQVEIISKDGVSKAPECRLDVPAEKSDDAASAPDKPVIESVTAMDQYTAVVCVKPQKDCTYEFLRSASRDGKYTTCETRDEPFFYDEHTDKKIDWFYRVRAIRGKYKSELSEPQKTGYQPGTTFNVPVLMYHEFVTDEDLKSGIAFDEYAIYDSEFETDLKWIRDKGYTTITTTQLIDYLSGKGKMPDKPIIITIDDGKYGVYKHAWRILQKYHMVASLAIIGYEIDNATVAPEARSKSIAPYCTWQELAEMSESGTIEIISHTDKQHYFLHDGRKGACTKDGDTLQSFLPIAQKDYSDTARNFNRHLNTVPTSMAYPYSIRTELSDEAWLKAGFKLLYAGDDEYLRYSTANYFVREAGLNRKSSVLRRVARETKHTLDYYLDE